MKINLYSAIVVLSLASWIQQAEAETQPDGQSEAGKKLPAVTETQPNGQSEAKKNCPP